MFQRFFLSLLVGISFLLLSGIAAAQEAYEVVLVPDPQGAAGQIGINRGYGCTNNPHDGCMLFPVDTSGQITFTLLGPQKNTICNDLRNTSARRVITSIVLSTDQDKTKPHAGKYGHPVDPWLKQYAFASVTKSNGEIYKADVSDGRTSVTLTNDNKHPTTDGPKSFWYQVTVTDCNDSTKHWTFDPRGDNEGSHN